MFDSNPIVIVYKSQLLNLQDKEGELFPKDDNEKLLYQSVDHVDTWRAMEKCVD